MITEGNNVQYSHHNVTRHICAIRMCVLPLPTKQTHNNGGPGNDENMMSINNSHGDKC